ncbi:cysteine hydrolase family protein [Enterococcus wangshanyuanii]|uniref:Amidase n=1 Tax=Enterococcus wangshanyuanii TaxID=2005703 RepID=A0ABQ1P5T6_9ENTE|nr:cysteine hydrolase family protein [Enterococcus wangshanyuanii]GGC91763.1 amidase [Enterococcus wangshanyuanii]
MTNRALIVIDLQNGLEQTGNGLFQLNDVLTGVNQRICAYRKQQQPIIFIQHEDEELIPQSHNWQLFEQLDARSEDYYVGKTHANSFFKTVLKQQLDALAVTELEFCGAQTEYCVDTTIRMAHGLGYTNFMKKGLSTTLNNELLGAKTIIQHHEQLWDKRFLTFI